jgi:tetratricopeptide (TPR) repeat protein
MLRCGSLRRTALQLCALVLVPVTATRAQDISAVIDLAERDRAAFNATGALAKYETALATAPTSYELLWRAAREAVDLGEAAPDATQRTATFRKAEGYARRAVAANAGAADGHFMLAVALGRTALSVGVRERVKYAGEVRAEALAATRIEPNHPGALHVLGVWNAEVMRLNSFSRFAARNFLGGRVFDQASWAEAVRFMEAAVRVDPTRPTHRLDLAKIYADAGQKPKARETCEFVRTMRVAEFNDSRYKQECEQLLTRWR